MSEGVIGTDGKQRVVVVNQRAGELFSFGSAQAQGKMLWEIVREEAVLKAATEVLASGERKAFQISPAAGTYLEITACPTPGRRAGRRADPGGARHEPERPVSGASQGIRGERFA